MAIDGSHQHDAARAPGQEATGTVADQSGGIDAAVLTSGSGGRVQVPDAAFISNGHFVKSGSDLILTEPGGDQVIVRDYFASDASPDLVAPDGTQVLTPELAQSFLRSAAPGQYAQVGPAASTPPIGQIDELTGEAFAVRADGTRVQLAKGDPVYQGDIIETGADGSAVRMIFADKTMFALGADARLALDELTFNPESLSGSAQFSVLKGVFIFSSGQIAKTDNTDMTVSTPVATIGIRGTEVAGRVDDQGGSQFTVIDGVIEVTTQAGSVTLDSQGETTRVTDSSTPPSPSFVLTPAEYGDTYNEVAGVASSYLNHGQSGQPGGPSDSGAPEGQDRSNVDDGNTDSSEETAEQTSSTLLASTLPAQQTAASGLAGGAIPGFRVPEAPLGETLNPVPVLDLALNLTYDGAEGSQDGPSSSGAADGDVPSPSFAPFTPDPESGQAGGDADIQPAAHPADGGGNPVGGPQGSVGTGNTGSQGGVDQNDGSPVFGSGDSPFRTHGDGSNPLGDNPYVQDPFGSDLPLPDYGGAGDDGVGSSGGAPPAPVEEDDDVEPVSAPPVVSEPEPDPHAITLILSNRRTTQELSELDDELIYELEDLGPGSEDRILGADTPIPDDRNHPKAHSGDISVVRDEAGDVSITLNSAWDSIKNLRAESDTAANLTATNFVHVDVDFGDGGDSHIELVDAKRGHIRTGDGNDTIDIDAKSDGPGALNWFDVETGDGNDLLDFNPTAESRLDFDGGAGIDTLRLTGPGDSFDLSSPKLQIANVERIDLTGSDDVTLTIGPNDIFNNSTGLNAIFGLDRSLVIDGDADDKINLIGGGWEPSDTPNIDGYAIYRNDSGDRVVADAAIEIAFV